ncbi:MAG TPA: hypothetical protein VJ836_00150 [Candidatus Saccharimonadales bacterium]|nr:hypothetical protein [Candidatus Saccharimonadales bacterium]
MSNATVEYPLFNQAPVDADIPRAEMPIGANPALDYLRGETRVEVGQLRFTNGAPLAEVPVMQPDGMEATVQVPLPAGMVIYNKDNSKDTFYVKRNGDIRAFSLFGRTPRVVRERQAAADEFHREVSNRHAPSEAQAPAAESRLRRYAKKIGNFLVGPRRHQEALQQPLPNYSESTPPTVNEDTKTTVYPVVEQSIPQSVLSSFTLLHGADIKRLAPATSNTPIRLLGNVSFAALGIQLTFSPPSKRSASAASPQRLAPNLQAESTFSETLVAEGDPDLEAEALLSLKFALGDPTMSNYDLVTAFSAPQLLAVTSQFAHTLRANHKQDPLAIRQYQALARTCDNLGLSLAV